MVSNVQAHDIMHKIGRVDEVMRQKGWSVAIAQELANELGVSMRQVYRWRGKAQRWTQAHMKADDVARWRAAQLQLADQAAREALMDKDYTAVAKLLQVGAGLAGTIAPTNVNVNHAVTVIPPAVSARLSGLSTDELRQIAERGREVIEVEATPVPVVAGDDNGR